MPESRLTDQARKAVEKAWLRLLRDRYPGRFWIIERDDDRREPAIESKEGGDG